MDKQILCDHCIAVISLSYLSSTTLHTTDFVTKVILESNGPKVALQKYRKKYTEKTTRKIVFNLTTLFSLIP